MAGDPLLREDEIAAVAAAIEAAETRTSGEIVVITAEEVSSYRYIPLAWAVLAALIVPLVLAMTVLPFESLGDGWGSGEPLTARAGVAYYAVLQALTFLVAGAIASIPAVRRRLTPRWIRQRRVRRAAVEQFLARDLHRTRERNGVLLFAALADRDVEIVADEAAQEAVSQAEWDRAAAAVASGAKAGERGRGLSEAVGILADALAGPFPPRSDDSDELPNTVVRL